MAVIYVILLLVVLLAAIVCADVYLTVAAERRSEKSGSKGEGVFGSLLEFFADLFTFGGDP